MSLTMSARDANQNFSEMLGKVIDGETVIITKHGQPVATLAPYRPETASPERQAAWDRLLARLEKGVPAPPGGWVFNRDELHERD